MRVRSLRTYDLPDVGNYLIHFTGRNGLRMNVDDEILALSAGDRLLRILLERKVRGFQTFGVGWGNAVVALTESVQATVRRVIADGQYDPFGIGFSKQTIFEMNGGPVLYVRGDEWDAARDALFGGPLRPRLVRFWPGAVSEEGEELAEHIVSPSEWLHEREWRVPGDLGFATTDVAFVIVPTTTWQEEHAAWLAGWAGEEYGDWFRAIPTVAIDEHGNLLADSSGIWI